MKLLELLEQIEIFKRIRRKKWVAPFSSLQNFVVIRSQFDKYPLISLDYPTSMQLKDYVPTVEDLLADDWEII